MTIEKPEYDLWYQALASPIGIVVSVSDYAGAYARFMNAKRSMGDPALDNLQIRRSPHLPEQELWIVKKSVIPREAFDEAAKRKIALDELEEELRNDK